MQLETIMCWCLTCCLPMCTGISCSACKGHTFILSKRVIVWPLKLAKSSHCHVSVMVNVRVSSYSATVHVAWVSSLCAFISYTTVKLPQFWLYWPPILLLLLAKPSLCFYNRGTASIVASKCLHCPHTTRFLHVDVGEGATHCKHYSLASQTPTSG